MAWRGIHLTRPAHLSSERHSMLIDFRDAEIAQFRISLEDLSYLIVDTLQATFSATLLSRLSQSGVLVVGVNDRHLPVWTSLPWTEFHRPGEVLTLQMGASRPLKKQMWSHIVARKIDAQAACLDHLARDGSTYLRALIPRIKSGDAGNVEARAARLYWSCLFQDREFRRHDDDLPNAILNYGYAILRAALARLLCAAGFIPQIGIHHQSLSNAYNLADDLLEPYRPMVDRLAAITLGGFRSDEPFSTEHRRAMARIFETNTEIEGEVYAMLSAMELSVVSFKKALATKDPRRLVFPTDNPQ